MNYLDYVKNSIRRSTIRSLVAYVILLALAGLSAFASFTYQQSIRLLDMLPVPSTVAGAFFLIISLFLVYVLIQTIGSLRRGQVFTDFLESIRKFGDPPTVCAHVDRLPKSDLCSLGDFRCDEKYVAYLRGDRALVRPTHHIVWGYIQDPSARRSAPGTTSRPQATQNVVLRMTERESLVLRTQNLAKAEALLQFIQERCPQMTAGYSVKYESSYAKNPENLRLKK